MPTVRIVLLGLGVALINNGQILFDTDSGVFGDDGVALAMIMRSPRAADVKAVTVVAGNSGRAPERGTCAAAWVC